MSSPPNYATSPPYPPSLSLPKKRPSQAQPGPTNPKRRKPSATPSVLSAHPLRQTSFPPEGTEAVYSPSPSVDDSVAGSTVTANRGKRVRKDARSATGTSTRGGRVGSGTGAGSVGAGAGGGEAAAENDDDEEDEGPENTMLEGAKMDEAAKRQEREHLSMLVEAFNRDQEHRYDVWRRVKLNVPTLRRLVNHTLSQSVNATVIYTVNGFTKVFIGEIIERALDVQRQWLAAAEHLPATVPGEKDGNNKPVREVNPEPGVVRERDRGPLTPDHLREALRRYKKDREGGGAGFMGLSLQGKENAATRMGGKKLFK